MKSLLYVLSVLSIAAGDVNLDVEQKVGDGDREIGQESRIHVAEGEDGGAGADEGAGSEEEAGATEVTEGPTCDPGLGWVQSDDLCYHVNTENKNFLEAAQYCRQRGGVIPDEDAKRIGAKLQSSHAPIDFWGGYGFLASSVEGTATQILSDWESNPASINGAACPWIRVIGSGGPGSGYSTWGSIKKTVCQLHQ